MNHQALRTGGALLAAAGAALGISAFAPAAGSATLAPPTTVVVHVSPNKITYSGSHTLPAGRFVFHAKANRPGNTLVVLRLHRGYTMQQAERDVNATIAAGGPSNPVVVRRIDRRISWLGGTQAPGSFETILTRGRYILIDEAPGNAVAFLTVTGKPQRGAAEPAKGGVWATSRVHGDRFETTRTLPANGWISFDNKTDEPHFLAIQHVKQSTTDADIRKHIADERQPSFVLRAGTQSGPVSSGRVVQLKLDLPPGKYLIACFWPSDENGMPHAFMGMWTLVQVR